jgi:hypothetical protein
MSQARSCSRRMGTRAIPQGRYQRRWGTRANAAIHQGWYVAGSHAQNEAINDGLKGMDIWSALTNQIAEIIEEYPDDPRGPSCLILCCILRKPVHVQVAYPSKR